MLAEVGNSPRRRNEAIVAEDHVRSGGSYPAPRVIYFRFKGGGEYNSDWKKA